MLRGGNNIVSTDGYRARKLKKAFELYEKKYKKDDYFVSMGHPKACTLYSLKMLEKFLKHVKTNHNILTFNEIK